MNKIKLD